MPPAKRATDKETISESSAAHSTATRIHYACTWRRFCVWAEANGHTALPCTPETMESYLEVRHAMGRAPGTLRADRAAIRYYHRRAGDAAPSDTEVVHRLLRKPDRVRSAGPRGGQDVLEVAGLTRSGLEEIRATATNPRIGSGGYLEKEDVARARGLVEIALVSTMRDALLRRSEAAKLQWGAVMFRADGTGRLSADGRPEQYLSPPTVDALRAIRPRDVPAGALVFGLKSGRSIANRIKAAADAAGLPGNFTGSSPRIGMAEDLDRAGIRLSALEVTRRWHDALMPDLVTAAYYGEDRFGREARRERGRPHTKREDEHGHPATSRSRRG